MFGYQRFYSKSKLELKSNLNEFLPVNSKFDRDLFQLYLYLSQIYPSLTKLKFEFLKI